MSRSTLVEVLETVLMCLCRASRLDCPRISSRSTDDTDEPEARDPVSPGVPCGPSPCRAGCVSTASRGAPDPSRGSAASASSAASAFDRDLFRERVRSSRASWICEYLVDKWSCVSYVRHLVGEESRSAHAMSTSSTFMVAVECGKVNDFVRN